MIIFELCNVPKALHSINPTQGTRCGDIETPRLTPIRRAEGTPQKQENALA